MLTKINKNNKSLFISRKEFAELMGVHVSTISHWHKNFPDFPVPVFRLGSRSVRYRISDVEEFINREIPNPLLSSASQEVKEG